MGYVLNLKPLPTCDATTTLVLHGRGCMPVVAMFSCASLGPWKTTSVDPGGLYYQTAGSGMQRQSRRHCYPSHSPYVQPLWVQCLNTRPQLPFLSLDLCLPHRSSASVDVRTQRVDLDAAVRDVCLCRSEFDNTDAGSKTHTKRQHLERDM